MLRIGDFSQLAQVSIRTLRHYDELGLLKPTSIDRFTDYRYYTIEQLPRLNRILAFKDLGFSLEQIKPLLDEDIPLEQLRGMLLLKQAEIEQHVYAERERLARVAARLKQIEQEGKTSPSDVLLKKVPAQIIVSARQVVPSIEEMKLYRCKLLEAVYAEQQRHHLQLVTPELVLYHTAEYQEQNLDIEIALGIDPRSLPTSFTSAEKGVMIRKLDAVPTMASVIHHGSIYGVGKSMIALFTWMEAHGYQTSGAYREVHLFGREDDEQIDLHNIVIEMQIPVQPSEKLSS